MKGLVHWDEVDGRLLEAGPLGVVRVDLGDAAGTRRVGVARLRVQPGKRSSPVHVELDEEEIFYVLGGSGLLWQEGGVTCEIGPGDCIVQRAAAEAHTLIAGPDGLDVLAFGERTSPTATYLPHAGVLRMEVTVDVSQGPEPWEREAAAGELEGEPGPRPANVTSRATVEGEYGGRSYSLARAGGAVRTGLNLLDLPAGESGAPPHCHSGEEEIFVVLAGGGTLELWPSPQKALAGVAYEEVSVRAGHVVSRPPGTGVAHAFRAGEEGITLLAYGTKDTNDICFYPRSNKIAFRGVGLIARLENLSYFDGEPD